MPSSSCQCVNQVYVREGSMCLQYHTSYFGLLNEEAKSRPARRPKVGYDPQNEKSAKSEKPPSLVHFQAGQEDANAIREVVITIERYVVGVTGIKMTLG
eukprot:scaffold1332_cov137-Skeletonema_menzelii.AAC.6